MKESIINKIYKIVANLPDDLINDKTINYRCIERDGVTIYLAGDTLISYNQLKNDLLNKAKWSEKFSERYVDRVLRDCIFNIINHGFEKTIELFSNTCSQVEAYSDKQTVYLLVSGIRIYDLEEFEIGNVKFIKMTEENLEKILRLREFAIRRTKNQPEEQDFFIEEGRRELSNKISGKILVSYQTIAEPYRAKELAEKETQDVLDLLRFSIPILYPNKDGINISILSEFNSSNKLALISSSNNFVTDRTSLIRNYELSPRNIQKLEEIGVLEMSNVLKKPSDKWSAFEKKLHTGIYWFASSQTQSRIENEYLNLVTCLEVFFSQEGSNTISNLIAEGTAFVLGRNLSERRCLKERVKKLYEIRGRVSHGRSSSVTLENVIELKDIVRKTLSQLIKWKKDFVSLNDLSTWLEEQRLS